MKINKIIEEFAESFPMEKRGECIIIKIDEKNIYNNLHLIFFRFLFQRLIDLFLRSVDDENCHLILFLEHRDYPVRTRVEIDIPKNFLPLKSFAHLWRNSSFYELLINRSLDVFCKDESIDFIDDSSKMSDYIKWVPSANILNGEGQLYYKLDQDVILSIVAEIGFEHKGVEDLLKTKPLELYPALFKSFFPKHYISFTVLFYKSIEDLLEISISLRDQALRMILLELDRIQDVFHLLKNVFLNSKIDVLLTATNDILSDLDSLFSENCDDHFGLLYPQKRSTKFSAGWIKSTIAFIEKAQKTVKHIDRILSNNSFFYTSQVAKLTEFTYDQQLDGFLLKANGGNHDLRTFSPYYLYKELNLSPALGQQKKVVDFYFVWIEELKASIQNIDLLLAGMPAYNDKDSFTSINYLEQFESEIGSILSKRDSIIYSSIDTLRGELGVWWEYVDNRPFLRIKPAGCFSLVYFLDLVKGLHVEDAFWLLPFLGINLNELEK